MEINAIDKNNKNKLPPFKQISHSYLKSFTLLLFISTTATTFAEESEQYYDFFSRAADIGQHEVWTVTEFSEGENTLDMNVQRWDNDNDGWSGCKENSNCTENSHQLDWNVPVYAPADGYIRQCARNFDDNPAPGQSAPGRLSKPRTIYGGGNHVFLETDQGDVILLAHMRKGTIPTSVCPIEIDEIVNINDKTGSYRTEMFIPEVDRPFVKRGQYIGRIGNSGSSSGPHMHIHIDQATGPDTQTTHSIKYPIPFKQMYAQNWYSGSNAQWNQWYTFEGGAITESGAGNTMIRPAPFLYRSKDESAGYVSELDTVFLSNSWAVTAIRNSDNKLQLTTWKFTGATGIERKHDLIEGNASFIKIAKVSSDKFVVALRDSDNNLKLILYRMSFFGTFTRLDDYTSGYISKLEMTSYGSGVSKKLMTAIRDSNNNLKLISWKVSYDLDAGDYRIDRLASRTEGYVSALTITAASNFNGVIVAVRTAGGKLKTIPYRISSSGETFTRGTDKESGPVSTKLSLVAIPQGVVVAARDNNGNLKMLSYKTSAGNAGGDILFISSIMTAGKISEVDINRTLHAGSDVITSLRDSDGNLLLVSWGMNHDGTEMRRGGSIKAGGVHKISSAARYRLISGVTPRDMLLTAIKDSHGELSLVNWDVNLKH